MTEKLNTTDLVAQLREEGAEARGLACGGLCLRAAEEIKRLRAEVADLKCSVVAFGAPAAARWAENFNLPPRHIHPTHYDILQRAGARMDDFVRGEVPGVQSHG